MGDSSNFERREIVGSRLVAASCDKAATLLGASRATVSEVMSAYTNHESTTSVKRNSGVKFNTDRKRSSYIEKDCFEESQNYCSRSDRTAELNIRLEDPVSTKTVQCKLHKSNIHGGAAIAKPLITDSNAQLCKR
jgi:hypothetical protein